MQGMPKRNSSFRLEKSVKKAAAAALAAHGMTLTEAIEGFLEEPAYHGEPAVCMSRKARMHAEALKFDAFMESRYGRWEPSTPLSEGLRQKGSQDETENRTGSER